jgi:hypothetical protein
MNKGFNFEIIDGYAEAQNKATTAAPKAIVKKAVAKPKPLPPPKLYYDVKVESMLPATLTYRVLAETPEQAAELIKGMAPVAVKHKLIGKKDLKMTVYESGSLMIKWMKNLVGR